ncbi:MAG: hypothetical protein QME32_00445 [Endomicrobiia bacterium]|nr:hypothetical protein [Endomicrobiia bacterium]
MKIVKIISYSLLAGGLMFLVFLRAIVLRPASQIESRFNIAVALDGTLNTEVVADRILAIDGVKDARVRKSAAIFEEYRKEKIISEKIRLDENTFNDLIVVHPESVAADMADLAARISATGGVDDVSYDAAAVEIYAGLMSVERRILYAALLIAAGVFIMAVIIIAGKIKSSGPASKNKSIAAALKPLPYLYYIAPVSALCYAGFAALARSEGLPFDYAVNGVLLALISAIASAVYAD